MEMYDFETGLLASSRQVASMLFGGGVSVGRVGRSAVSKNCFFIFILNNAPALRASKNQHPERRPWTRKSAAYNQIPNEKPHPKEPQTAGDGRENPRSKSPTVVVGKPALTAMEGHIPNADPGPENLLRTTGFLKKATSRTPTLDPKICCVQLDS